MDYRMMKLRQYIRGWINYFGIAGYYRPIPGIDEWIRRRLRMCYWKQWRYVRTKVRNLLKLGTNKRHAILSALSRKSYWHLSKSFATQTGMPNEWLEKQGLVSVKKLWSRITTRLRLGNFVKRQVRTRMLGVVGAGGETPPATRLYIIL